MLGDGNNEMYKTLCENARKNFSHEQHSHAVAIVEKFSELKDLVCKAPTPEYLDDSLLILGYWLQEVEDMAKERIKGNNTTNDTIIPSRHEPHSNSKEEDNQ
jgi:hypothetical protein